MSDASRRSWVSTSKASCLQTSVRLPLLLLVAAALWRLFYAIPFHSGPAGGGEAFNAARSFAMTRTIGDYISLGRGLRRICCQSR